LNQVEGMGPAGEERGVDVAVKSGKAPAVFYRETEQVEIGEIFGDWKRGEEAGIGHGEIIRPELVSGRVAEANKYPARLQSGTGTSGVAAPA
jgi:hypothetical protein